MRASVDLFGVRIDRITMDQAIDQVAQWCTQKGKHYIVTPNVEFIIKAQDDRVFKKILNDSDMAIPDSARFGWAIAQQSEKNSFIKVLHWPLFLIKNDNFPVVTGTDLMQELCQKAAKEGWSVGLLGGQPGVAKKTAVRLEKLYPGLKVSFAESGPVVNQNGETVNQLISDSDRNTDSQTHRSTDLLFVAFGQGKQEKWIVKNLEKLPIKVAMGVGGAFDYLSGDVARAPQWMRQLGLEWLFRLILQPWRAKRFLSLIKFVFKV